MEDVLYVPAARRNLFSVVSVLDKGMKFTSSKNGCEFAKSGVVKACGKRVDQLFKMMLRVKTPKKTCIGEINLSTKDYLHVWHERLGHQNRNHVRKFLKKNNIDFIDDDHFCSSCIEGKQHRNSFQQRQQRAELPGEIMHADLCGPMETASLGGAKYFLCFTCDYSRLRIVYFLKEKSETIGKINEMLQVVKNQCGSPLKTFQCDGGLEFNNESVRKLLKLNGITMAITNPYTPEQNGCAERSNRTIVELARTMRLSKNLPKFLWAETVNTAVYILNRTGTSRVQDKTPYELFTGKNVHVKNLRIFGTPCFVHVPKQHRKKWDSKSQRGILVGYSDSIEGYRIWLKSSNQIIRSRDVVFEPEYSSAWIPDRPETINEEPKDQRNALPSPVPTNSSSEDLPEEDQSTETPKPSERGLRDRAAIRPPRRLIESMLAEIDEPGSFSQAINSPDKQHWEQAMKKEIASLKENSTWSLVELPIGRKAISNRWIYRVKRNAEGKISRYKARLVVRGFSQREGIDFNETFSPVARFDTIRTVLSIAANEGLQLAQFDVETAFLNGIIEENIYMDQPEGFKDNTNRVCKLHKSLYGLKQSPRIWNDTFKNVMNDLGFQQSVADPCMFYCTSDTEKLIVVLYVDDGLVVGTSKTTINEFLTNLASKFKITIESSSSFLNISIGRQDDGSIFIGQKAYAESILKRFNLEDANPVSTAIEKGQLSNIDVDEELINIPYREAVGCLMYLAVATRPDIAYAVNFASQFLEKPGQQHWAIVKRIFKYIKGTSRLGIRYDAASKTGMLEAYSDADYANDATTRRSISGIVIKYSGGAITWASRRQDCISLSTTEAEYIASSEATKDIIWLTRLFDEISPLKTEPVLLVDNASAIKIVKNPIFHRRSKHIEVRFHFVRECYQKKLLKIEHVSSNDQLADILTKPIPRVQYERLRKLLGIIEQHS